ncbi:MAG: tetratricopeptide repeat protein [Planctomycetes bacterium]|nr:tetratricopeptide repeat protein [Planctomycetota bacterium]
MSSRKHKSRQNPQSQGSHSRERERKQHARSARRGGRVVLLLGVLALGALVVVVLTRRGRVGIEVPVPTDLESFDPQITAYLKKHIQRAQEAPQDFDAQATLGMVYGANSVWREARACFANAALLRPAEPLARHHEAIATNELGETETAFEMFGQIAREFPAFAPSRHRYGVGLIFRGRLEEAAAELERVIALAPSAPEAYIGLGEVRLREGDLAASVRHLQKALQINSRLRRARHLLGSAYLKLGRTAEAKRYLSGGAGSGRLYLTDSWFQEQQQHALVLSDQISRALGWLEAGQPAEGARILEEALSWRPGNVDVSNNLAIMYLELGRVEEALRLIRDSLRQDDSRFETYINLAALQMRMKEFEKALTTINRAVAIAPQVAQVHVTHGHILLQLGRTEDGIEELESASRLDAENLATHMELAQFYLRVRRYPEAKEHYQAFVDGDPANFGALVRLCHVCIQLGDLEEAEELLGDLYELDPEHVDVAKLQRELGARRGE